MMIQLRIQNKCGQFSLSLFDHSNWETWGSHAKYNIIGHRTRPSIRQYFLVVTTQLFSQQRANLAAWLRMLLTLILAHLKNAPVLPKVTCMLVIFSFLIVLSHWCKFVYADMTIFVYKNITITFLLSRDIANTTLCLRYLSMLALLACSFIPRRAHFDSYNNILERYEYKL